MKKEENKGNVMEEKTKILMALDAISKKNIGVSMGYFEHLKGRVELLFERKDIPKRMQENQEKFQWIGAYLEEMQQNQSMFLEEPLVEEYEGQEIMWPTTLALWQEDMEEILEQVAK